MYQISFLFFFFYLQRIQSLIVTTTQFNEINCQEDQKKEQNLTFCLNSLKSPEISSKNLFLVVIIGKQGVMKSTLLRSLEYYFNLKDSEIKFENSNISLTTSVTISEATIDEDILIDQPGNVDNPLEIQTEVTTTNLNLIFTQLIAPLSNVLIHVTNPSSSLFFFYSFFYFYLTSTLFLNYFILLGFL